MVGVLLFLFIAIPIAEIVVFVQMGGLIGLWPTVAAVIFTAVFGAALLRRQGISTLMRLRESLEQGRIPLEEIFDGVCLFATGLLLLTPGFITDSFGFLLLFPPFRALLRRELGRQIKAGRVHVHQSGFHGPGQRPPSPDPTVIDGEWETLDESEKPRSGDSPWGK